MLPSKWENLNRCSTKLIHFCKKLPLALDCMQSKYSLQIYDQHFFQFWAWLLRFLFCIISKNSSFLWEKGFENFFAALYYYLYELKKCLRVLKPYFKMKILIFLSFVVSFIVDMFNKKVFFWCKKHQRWNLRHILVEKLSQINVAKY